MSDVLSANLFELPSSMSISVADAVTSRVTFAAARSTYTQPAGAVSASAWVDLMRSLSSTVARAIVAPEGSAEPPFLSVDMGALVISRPFADISPSNVPPVCAAASTCLL